MLSSFLWHLISIIILTLDLCRWYSTYPVMVYWTSPLLSYIYICWSLTLFWLSYLFCICWMAWWSHPSVWVLELQCLSHLYSKKTHPVTSLALQLTFPYSRSTLTISLSFAPSTHPFYSTHRNHTTFMMWPLSLVPQISVFLLAPSKEGTNMPTSPLCAHSKAQTNYSCVNYLFTCV